MAIVLDKEYGTDFEKGIRYQLTGAGKYVYAWAMYGNDGACCGWVLRYDKTEEAYYEDYAALREALSVLDTGYVDGVRVISEQGSTECEGEECPF